MTKGTKEGACARKACTISGNEVVWYNSSTRAYYCGQCAWKINRAANERVCSKEDA